MKLLKSIACLSLLLVTCNHVSASAGVVTLMLQGPSTNQFQIAATETARYRGYGGGFGNGWHFFVIKDNVRAEFTVLPTDANGFIIAGPATIGVENPNGSGGAFSNWEIQPSPFPPGKAVTVGPYAGNVMVTMEVSGDLVNWVPAVNGAVYTNSPDARFFRIKMVTNATP